MHINMMKYPLYGNTNIETFLSERFRTIYDSVRFTLGCMQ